MDIDPHWCLNQNFGNQYRCLSVHVLHRIRMRQCQNSMDFFVCGTSVTIPARKQNWIKRLKGGKMPHWPDYIFNNDQKESLSHFLVLCPSDRAVLLVKPYIPFACYPCLSPLIFAGFTESSSCAYEVPTSWGQLAPIMEDWWSGFTLRTRSDMISRYLSFDCPG